MPRITDLPDGEEIQDGDLFVVSQEGLARKVSWSEIFTKFNTGFGGAAGQDVPDGMLKGISGGFVTGVPAIDYPGLNTPNTFNQIQKLPLCDTGGQVYNVKAYGAVGDGAHDDTAAIQSVIDLITGDADPAESVRLARGSIYLPPGSYKITSPLRIWSVIYITFSGAGRTTRLMPVGEMDTVLDLNGVAFSTFSDFLIEGDTINEQVQDVIAFRWLSTEARRTSSGCSFRNIQIQGTKFVTGFRIGQWLDTGQVDTSTYENMIVNGYWTDSETTWYQNGFVVGSGTYGNNLVHSFWNCSVVLCATGFYIAATNFMLCGGSFSANGVDFNAQTLAYFLIQGIRSETAHRFLTVGSGPTDSAANVSLTDIVWEVNNIAGDGQFIVWTGTNGTLAIRNLYVGVLAPNAGITMDPWNAASLIIDGITCSRTRELFLSEVSSKVDINVRGFTTLKSDGSGWQGMSQGLMSAITDRGGQVFNVKAYGATGNGTTDDTSSIQAAINAAPPGAYVYLPVGRYVVSSTLTIAKDLTFTGCGGYTPLSGAYGGSWDSPSTQTGTVLVSSMTSGTVIRSSTNSHRVVFKDFVLIGLGGSGRTTIGIQVGATGSLDPQVCAIDGVSVANFLTGIDCNAVSNSRIDGCSFLGCSTGLAFNAGTNNNYVRSLTANGCVTGVLLTTAKSNTFIGGSALNSVQLGFRLSSNSDSNIIEGMAFDSTTSLFSIDVLSGDYGTIIGCTFNSSGDNVRIIGDSTKISPTKATQGLQIYGHDVLIIGDWGSLVDDQGVGTTYITSSSVYNVKSFGAKGDDVNDDTAAIQACIEKAAGPGDPTTTLRGVGGTVYLPPGNYKITAPLRIHAVQSFNFIGTGLASRIHPVGVMDSALDMNGVAYSFFSDFNIQGNDAGDIVTNAIYYYCDDPMSHIRSTTTNVFQRINISNIKCVTAFRIGAPGTGWQCDNTSYYDLRMQGNWVPGEATYYQYGMYVGDDIFANNLIHATYHPEISNFKEAVHVGASNYSQYGGSFSTNGTDFVADNLSYFSVQAHRSENSGRLFVSRGSDGNAANYGLYDIIWTVVPSGVNPDYEFIQMHSSGTLIINNLSAVGDVPLKMATGASLGQTVKITGITINSPLATFLGTVGASTKVIIEGYYQYGPSGAVEWILNGTHTFPSRKTVSTGFVLRPTDPQFVAITSIPAPTNMAVPLANSVPAGHTFTFKDESGTAGTNNVTIVPTAPDTLEAPVVLSTNYQLVSLYSDGVSKWFLG